MFRWPLPRTALPTNPLEFPAGTLPTHGFRWWLSGLAMLRASHIQKMTSCYGELMFSIGTHLQHTWMSNVVCGTNLQAATLRCLLPTSRPHRKQRSILCLLRYLRCSWMWCSPGFGIPCVPVGALVGRVLEGWPKSNDSVWHTYLGS
jgi:hypothetical protein